MYATDFFQLYKLDFSKRGVNKYNEQLISQFCQNLTDLKSTYPGHKQFLAPLRLNQTRNKKQSPKSFKEIKDLE